VKKLRGPLFILLFLALSLSALTAAATDIPMQFDNPAMQQRYMTLLGKLRCLVCQNETLAVSQADLAQDLREQIFHMMADGKTNKQITDYLVARYGDFVLYDPPLQRSTWLLWFGPFLFLIFGLYFMVRFIRSRRTKDVELEPGDRERLARLLPEPDKGK
jgi:cytochrome c-type biogenesis protein CcmH